MKKTDREALDAYYREAGSWAEDRDAALARSRRIAWIVAAAAGVVAVFEAVALTALAPLKTVVPYTLLVDRHTGFVQQLRPVSAETIAPDSALTQSFLVQYVIARETFDYNELQANYRKVALWSAPQARATYVAGMQATNPASPLVRYPRGTLVDTDVRSVSSLGGHTALVRFETRRHDPSGATTSSRAWVAVVTYRFSNAPLALADRFVNPLGFQVLSYRRDEEALPAPEPSPAAPNSSVVPAPSPGSILPVVTSTRLPGRLGGSQP